MFLRVQREYKEYKWEYKVKVKVKVKSLSLKLNFKSTNVLKSRCKSD